MSNMRPQGFSKVKAIELAKKLSEREHCEVYVYNTGAENVYEYCYSDTYDFSDEWIEYVFINGFLQ